MDWTAIVASLVSGVVAIGAVSLFLTKYMPKITKYAMLAKDAVETVNDIALALSPDADGKVELTSDEIAKIKIDAIQFQKDLAIL